MNIAFICTEKLPAPAIKGGAIQMMIDGVSPFLSEKHDLTVFSITDPDLATNEISNNVKYIRFPREHYRSHVAEELKNHQFDVIHVFNRPKNIPLYKSASPTSKFVLSLHNDMFSERKITDEEGNSAIEAVTSITTVSNYIKQTIIDRFPEAKEKISVVYSGVNLKDYPPVWTTEGQQIRRKYRKKYGIENRKVILFVGRLSKTKGPHLLIQAMKSIIHTHQDAVLVIVGGKWFSNNKPNSYVRYLYQLAQSIKEHVIFTKFVPPDEIPNIFLMGDVFVCSSQWNEPLARVHYEAMAAGVPLITTNRGGNAEVIKDEYNGILVEDYASPKAFAEIIHNTLSQPEFAEWIAQNGRKFVEINFDYKHVADRLERVYFNSVIENGISI